MSRMPTVSNAWLKKAAGICIVVALTGCVTPNAPLYRWGEYENVGTERRSLFFVPRADATFDTGAATHQ